MHIYFLALLVCLVIVSVTAQYKDADGNDCQNMCAVPLSWFPICGENGLTYSNKRDLECHEQCLKSSEFEFLNILFISISSVTTAHKNFIFSSRNCNQARGTLSVKCLKQTER